MTRHQRQAIRIAAYDLTSHSRRTGWASEAVSAFTRAQGGSTSGEEDITDLIADLLHLAASGGIAATIARAAWGHFEAGRLMAASQARRG
jgi:hypothetical protein